MSTIYLFIFSFFLSCISYRILLLVCFPKITMVFPKNLCVDSSDVGNPFSITYEGQCVSVSYCQEQSLGSIQYFAYLE